MEAEVGVVRVGYGIAEVSDERRHDAPSAGVHLWCGHRAEKRSPCPEVRVVDFFTCSRGCQQLNCLRELLHGEFERAGRVAVPANRREYCGCQQVRIGVDVREPGVEYRSAG